MAKPAGAKEQIGVRDAAIQAPPIGPIEVASLASPFAAYAAVRESAVLYARELRWVATCACPHARSCPRDHGCRVRLVSKR